MGGSGGSGVRPGRGVVKMGGSGRSWVRPGTLHS